MGGFFPDGGFGGGVGGLSKVEDDTDPKLGGNLDGQGYSASDMPLKGHAAVAGSGNLSTVGSSTTVTLPASDYTAILEGATLVANSLTRYVLSKDGSNNVTVDTAVDWSAGYTFTRQNPITQFVESDGTIQGWMQADGQVYFVGGVGIGMHPIYGRPLTIDGTAYGTYWQGDIKSASFSNPITLECFGPIANFYGVSTGVNSLNFVRNTTGNPFKIELVSTESDASLSILPKGAGNIGFGTTVFGTSFAGGIGMANGTAPTTSPADIAQMGVVDYAAGDARWYFMGEASTDKVYIGNGEIISIAKSSVQDRDLLRIAPSYIVDTDASRTSKTEFYQSDYGADRKWLEAQADGTETKIGLHGVTPVVQASHITDAPGDTAANNAVTINAILVALENIGIVASA